MRKAPGDSCVRWSLFYIRHSQRGSSQTRNHPLPTLPLEVEGEGGGKGGDEMKKKSFGLLIVFLPAMVFAQEKIEAPVGMWGTNGFSIGKGRWK